LPTNDHFSSSWTLVVEGGKLHELVVESAGVAAGGRRVGGDGVLADADQPAGLAHAAALGQVRQHGGRLLGRQAGVEQRRALALGEAGLAGAAAQQAPAVRAVAGRHRQVAGAALAVVGAVAVQAAEAAQVIIVGPSLAHRRSLRLAGSHHHRPRWYNNPRALCNTTWTRPVFAMRG
jgi:hypothetical protein